MRSGIVVSVVQSLYEALQSAELEKVFSMYGRESKLKDILGTVSTIIAVLVDAEAKQGFTEYVELYLGKLEDAIYEADDLLDEFLTRANTKKTFKGQKMLSFFSFSSDFVNQSKIFSEIRKISKKLDAITKVMLRFGLGSEPIKMKWSIDRIISLSHAYSEADIIGREEDLENIVGRLLDSDVQEDVSFLSIVGSGGVGKTTLAKLVYNNEMVTSAFPFRLWVYAGDGFLDIAKTLAMILASATGQIHQGSSLEVLQSQLLQQFAGRKYLLVLDDVWSEDRDQWHTLQAILRRGQRGSRVLVTTRLEPVTRIIGDHPRYFLVGLSNEYSWHLFIRMAFGTQQSNVHDDLVQIVKDIVRKCGGSPLAIKLLGSLLYGQDMNNWLQLLEIALSAFGDDGILSVLRLSYHHLESPLKSCFAYCALFPRDFVIEKQMVMSLWIAQGYVVPLYADQRLEDAAEEYFSILLQRSFFQDVKQDEYGEIISCKIHDLIFDLAQYVAVREICTIDSTSLYLNRGARHLCLRGGKYADIFSRTHVLRSLLVGGCYEHAKMDQFPMEASMIAKFVRLRTLCISNSDIRRLPDSVGKLLHLRYLDLSWNRNLKVLPKMITKLYNLMTLKVRGCYNLIELPENLYKLVNLRVLDTDGCNRLTYMPHSMGKLNNLYSLTEYVLADSPSNSKQWSDPLEELRALNNLKGCLKIRIEYPKNTAHSEEDRRRGGGYLSSKDRLNHIVYIFNNMQLGIVDYEENLMENLQPHFNLKGLDLCGYDGVRMPSWISSLPNLVRLHLENCKNLQFLPYLGNLYHLKVLQLCDLLNLEYVFEYSTTHYTSSDPEIYAPTGVSSAKRLSFLPSLEQLKLYNLPKLKGWSKSGVMLVVEDDNLLVGSSSMAQLQPLCLSQLKSLTISQCPELKDIPACSREEDLSVVGTTMSLIKQLIDPAAEKTDDIGVTEESEADASLVSSFQGFNLNLPLEKTPAVSAEDASCSDTPCPKSNLQLVSSLDGLSANDDALLYCALFPPDYGFVKETLLQLWMADGLFCEEPMEEYAGRFFDDCVTKRYFQSSRTILATGEAVYKFTGGSQLLSSRGDHFARIEGGSNLINVSPEVSHMSVSCRNLKDSTLLKVFQRFKQLRTLIFIHGHELSFRQVPRDFFLSLELLQVLDLSHTRLVELPSSIGNMKCLRCLDLTKTLIKHLPEAIDRLENLQTFKLRGCLNLSSLPKGMRKLAKLRHLDFDVLRQLRSMPEGMGDLTNLRTLSAFLIGMEEGCSISQLKNMNNLSGSFCISALENVLTEDEAVNAYLCYKSHIRKLELQWSDSQDKDIVGHREILSFLQPNASLEELCISCFGGFELPFWICDTTFSKLVSITLFKCENCVILPSVGQLPHLKSLNIVGFHKLKMIDHNFYGGFGIQGYIAFPELEKFTIQNMFNLEEWKDIGNSHFPKLSNLTVKHCPKLYSLCTLSFLRFLENLEINQCGMLASCFDGELPANLKTIIIEGCPLISARILEDKGEDYDKVAQITHVWIDHQEISLCQSSSEVSVSFSWICILIQLCFIFIHMKMAFSASHSHENFY